MRRELPPGAEAAPVERWVTSAGADGAEQRAARLLDQLAPAAELTAAERAQMLERVAEREEARCRGAWGFRLRLAGAVAVAACLVLLAQRSWHGASGGAGPASPRAGIAVVEALTCERQVLGAPAGSRVVLVGPARAEVRPSDRQLVRLLEGRVAVSTGAVAQRVVWDGGEAHVQPGSLVEVAAAVTVFAGEASVQWAGAQRAEVIVVKAGRSANAAGETAAPGGAHQVGLRQALEEGPTAGVCFGGASQPVTPVPPPPEPARPLPTAPAPAESPPAEAPPPVPPVASVQPPPVAPLARSRPRVEEPPSPTPTPSLEAPPAPAPKGPAPAPAPALPPVESSIVVAAPATPAVAAAPAAPVVPTLPAVAPPAQGPTQDEASQLSRVLSHLRGGRPAEALRLLDGYERGDARGALRLEARLARLDALISLGRRAEALAVIEQAHLGSWPRQTELRVLRGELRAEQGRCAGAVGDFTSVLELPASSAPAALVARALHGRAVCHGRLGNRAASRADLEAYLARFPRGPQAESVRRALAP